LGAPRRKRGAILSVVRAQRSPSPTSRRPRHGNHGYAWRCATRRLIYSLSALGLPLEARSTGGLAFAFKASTEEEPVFTGHSDGLITINIAEASNLFRENAREQMGEPYRTVLGHFRHVGHYYWDRLIKGGRWLEPFRALFGDDTLDYADAQSRHYEEGPPADWVARFVSAYPFVLSDPAIAKLRFVHDVIATYRGSAADADTNPEVQAKVPASA
jgi:hypothetical protein